MNLSNLREKEVVSLCDGSVLGHVCDIEIDSCCKCVCALIICLHEGRLFSFGKCRFLTIPIEKVEKFGDDVILVNISVRDEGKHGFCCRKKR